MSDKDATDPCNFIRQQPGVIAFQCCPSCHDDYDGSGYEMCYVMIDGTDYHVCCIAARAWQERKVAPQIEEVV